MVAIRYTRYCICDTDPPCRAHVHNNIALTTIHSLRARGNIYTNYRGLYALLAIEAQIPRTKPEG